MVMHQRRSGHLGIERFFELSSDLLVIADASGRFLRLSRSWLTVLGYSDNELTTRPFIDFIHPDDQESTRKAMAGLVAGEPAIDFVNRYRTKGGEYRHLSWRAAPAEEDGLIFAVARDITADVSRLRDLEDRQSRLDRALDIGRIGFWELDHGTGGLHWSPRIFDIFGLDPIRNLPSYELFLTSIHPDDRDRVNRTYHLAIDTRAPYTARHRLVRPDGTIRWVLEQGETVYDEAGRPLKTNGTVKDITDLAEELQAIDAERARLRAIMDTIPDLVFIKDRDFRYVACNPPFEAFMGHSEAELIGRDDFQVFEPEIAQFFRDHDTAMLASGQPRRNEEWVTYPDGRRVLLDTMKVPFCDQSGAVVGLLGVSRDITERLSYQRLIQEREAFYRAAIEASTDGFWLVDMSGRILDVNSAYARLSGYSLDALKTMRVADVEVVEAQADVEGRIAALKSSGAATFESRHRRKDGSVWDVEITLFHSNVEGGRVFAFLRDLRRRRRAESLLKTRLHLSEVARADDIDRLMTEVLDAAERLTGSSIGFFHFVDPNGVTLSLQAWSTNTLARMCTAEGKGSHYPIDQAGIWAGCLRQGRPEMCNDYPARADKHGLPDGHAAITRFLSVPVAGEHGFQAVIGVGNKGEDYDQADIDLLSELATIAMDIVNAVRADRRQRELAQILAKTALEWTAALDSFEGGIAILDHDHRLVRANAAFFALASGTPEARIGQKVHCLEDIDAPRAECPLCRDIGQHRSTQMVIEPDATGNPSGRPLELRMIPIAGGTGDTSTGWVMSLYDLTRVRDQERRMRQTIDALTRSNLELERFAKVTAHDLQEPARRQVLFAQLLERRLDTELDDETRAYLTHLIDGALSMREMVLQLSVYSESSRSVEAAGIIDLDAIATHVRDTFWNDIERTSAQICLGELGQALGQKSRVAMVLTNLLLNALRFRRPDTPPRISLEAEPRDGFVTLSVADNGIGIAPEYRHEVFDLFRRLNPRHVGSGTGMGLAQCRVAIEDMGGRIWIEGNPEGGTTVRFTLPLAD